MKTVGLIGGTGWPATRDYYELLYRLAQQRRGGLHALELRLWSFDFGALLDEVATQPQALLHDAFAQAARSLNAQGAQVLALASVTGHLFAPADPPMSMVHIATACAQALSAAGVRRIGVLGTRRALDGGVFASAFAAAGVRLALPPADVAQAVDDAIFGELEQAAPGPLTLAAARSAARAFLDAGVSDVLLGCTELRPALFKSLDWPSQLRLWDSTALHCDAILSAAGIPASTSPT